MRAAEAAAERLGVALHMVLVRTVEEYEEAFVQLAGANVQTVFVGGYALTVRGRPELLAQLALQYRLPSMFVARDNVVAGGLMSYSADLVGQHRRAATYIDKILKGAKPADHPVMPSLHPPVHPRPKGRLQTQLMGNKYGIKTLSPQTVTIIRDYGIQPLSLPETL